MKQKISNSR